MLQRRRVPRLSYRQQMANSRAALTRYLLTGQAPYQATGHATWLSGGKRWLVRYDGVRFTAMRQGCYVIAGSLESLLDTIGVCGIATKG